MELIPFDHGAWYIHHDNVFNILLNLFSKYLIENPCGDDTQAYAFIVIFIEVYIAAFGLIIIFNIEI